MGGFTDALPGAIGSVGGALLGGIIGSHNQSEANKTNLAINQANIDFQREMWNKQKEYNMEMWDKQNEYNSASAQVRRYRAAGLNPALMMQGQSAGVAQSANGMTMPSGSTTQVGAFDPSSLVNQAGTSIVSALNNLQNIQAQEELRGEQAASLRAETELKKIDALTRAERNVEDIKGMKSKRYNIDVQSMNTDQDYQFKRAAWSDMISMKHEELLSQRQQRVNMEAQEIATKMDIALKRIDLKYADKNALALLSRMAAETKMFMAGANLSYAHAEYTMQQRLESFARTYGINLDNKQKDDLMPLLLDKQSYENSILESHSSNLKDFGVSELSNSYSSSGFKLFGFDIGTNVINKHPSRSKK